MAVEAPNAVVDPGSFRDPSGFVFRRDGVLFRQVNEVHRAHYDRFVSSGVCAKLIDDGLLIPHGEVDVRPATDGAHRVLLPETVAFVSYPYEWSFSQLKEAALLTLRIQSIAMDGGMSLRDASAFNVQLQLGRPVLIDTLSFETLPAGRPWVAYRQFCEHFLAPLALMSYRDARLGLLLREHVDGVPLDLATSLLPGRAKRHTSLLLHLFGHARSQRRHAAGGARTIDSGRFSEQAFRGLIDSLRKGVETLDPPGRDSVWHDYYDEATHYSPEAAAGKEAAVGAMLAEVGPSTVWDLGANTGRFARLASDRGIDTVAFDSDPACVDESYRRMRAEGNRHLLPLVMDLANPSPGVGWANAERASLVDRGPADLGLALALVHHLAIGGNVPLPMIAELFARYCRRLVIEFIPKQDEKVQLMLRTRDDVFAGYTADGFERAFQERFSIDRSEPIAGSDRTLYLMTAR